MLLHPTKRRWSKVAQVERACIPNPAPPPPTPLGVVVGWSGCRWRVKGVFRVEQILMTEVDFGALIEADLWEPNDYESVRVFAPLKDGRWDWALIPREDLETHRPDILRDLGIASLPATAFGVALRLIQAHVDGAGPDGIGHAQLLKKRGVASLDNIEVYGALRRLRDMEVMRIEADGDRIGKGARYISCEPPAEVAG